MCGIYGSQDFNRFKHLYKLNTSRGNFAHGHVFINKDYCKIDKFPGQTEYMYSEEVDNFNLFLGHTQSPTGSVRQYSHETTHPFETQNWAIAHNGVLNNHKQIIKQYIPHHTCEVDSSIIGPLINHFIYREFLPEHEAISRALSELSGTYALFIYNKQTKNLYVARSGSTLYKSDMCIEFTSCKYKNMPEVPDGSLWVSNGTTFELIDTLKTNSSFFIL